MLNEERRRLILQLLSHDGRVLVRDLARHFRTSQVTIRKDLDILQAHGRIHRTHGGALPARESALRDLPVTVIGRMEPGRGVTVLDHAGQPLDLGAGGYRHF